MFFNNFFVKVLIEMMESIFSPDDLFFYFKYGTSSDTVHSESVSAIRMP